VEIDGIQPIQPITMEYRTSNGTYLALEYPREGEGQFYLEVTYHLQIYRGFSCSFVKGAHKVSIPNQRLSPVGSYSQSFYTYATWSSVLSFAHLFFFLLIFLFRLSFLHIFIFYITSPMFLFLLFPPHPRCHLSPLSQPLFFSVCFPESFLLFPGLLIYIPKDLYA
jgi:hypothetical protein